MKVMLVLGVAVLVGGVVALVKSQPYAVYYPLLLGGALTAGITAGLFPQVRRRYQQLELRKMQAMDAS